MAKRDVPAELSLEELTELLESWLLGLRAERKSAQTVKSYGDGVRAFLAWCHESATEPKLERITVSSWLGALAEKGNSPATMRSRQLSVKRFTRWLVEEGELSEDRLIAMRPVKIDVPVVQPLTDVQLSRLLKTRTGREFADIRDEAILRLMLETGIRAGECAALEAGDVDTVAGTVIIRRGKGGKGRMVAMSPSASVAIDRYKRKGRSKHLLAASKALWLGERGKPFTYDGLHKSLRLRAEAAGIEGFHPHLLRHTFAHRWLAAGGSEGGLRATGGWSRPDTMLRYTRTLANERALDESRSLGLGENL